MVVFVDRNPRMDLQPDLVPVTNRFGQWIESGVIKRIKFRQQLLSLRLGQICCKPAAKRLVFVGLRTPETVLIPLPHWPKQFAFVQGPAAIQDAPINSAPTTRFALVQHVVNAFSPPLDI